jgi:hypothetical protein
MNYKKKQQPEF